MKTQINKHVVFLLKLVSKIFAILVFGVGFFAVLGWQFDVGAFKKISSNLPVIAPNTAVSFLIIGLVVFLLDQITRIQRILRIVSGMFSLLIALLGAMTLAEYVFGLNFGIDNLLFAEKMGITIVRMSPQSAFNFLMVGLALFFYSNIEKEYINWGQILIITAGTTALISLLGFVYGVAGLYTIAPYKGMAVHTAVAFVATFLGILTIRPDTGIMRVFVGTSLSSLAARRLFFALLSILIIEILVMTGGRMGIYGFAYESLIHLLIVTGVFVYLIFYSFRSLDQLSEAEQKIEHFKEIDKAKTEFVSLASHQLRTPLTSVAWYSEMLLKHEVGVLSPKQKEYLEEVNAQNRRMIDLVDDLLNSSRIDMGMLNVEPRKIDLKKVLESVLEEMEPLIKEKNIQLEKIIGKEVPDTETDPEMVRIIFQNLISNAVKYTPENGKVSVRLNLAGNHFNFRVSDTGYGITKSQQNRVFTKMFRADNIRSKVTDGTGLGLYIARAVVKELKGKIGFESEENKGTTFFVEIPKRFYG